VVARRLAGMNAAAMAGGFLPIRGRRGPVRAGAANLVADVLESLDPEKLGGLAKRPCAARSPVRSGAAAGAVAGRDDRRWPAHAGDRGAARRAALALEANEELSAP
jgi:hypothetical protein